MMSMAGCGSGTSSRHQSSEPDEEEIDPMDAMKYKSEEIVNRFASEQGCSVEGADKLFEQVKMFLIVCAVKKGPFAPSVVMDEMWHMFVLHMKHYEEFCNMMGVMVYHIPTEPHLRPGLIRPAEELLEEATKLFGRKIDKVLWPSPSEENTVSGDHSTGEE